MKIPTNQIFWYLPRKPLAPLKSDARADVLIIGGGMAGLTAAQSFMRKGCSVILIEKDFCGAGASGKSSGFITPDSEFSLRSFVARYGAEEAKKLWEFVVHGCHIIRSNCETYTIECDFQVQDTLVVASSDKSFKEEIEAEYTQRRALGYDARLYGKNELSSVIGSQNYHGGISYSDTFGINGFQYLQAMKDILVEQGVKIYEETPAIELLKNEVRTPYGTITVEYVVLCTDRFTPELHKLEYEISAVQTFLMISAPLTEKQIKTIFPQRPYMVWDTELIYQYFRVTGDNRLLLGGSTLWGTYEPTPHYDNKAAYKKLFNYFSQQFPAVKPEFHFMWPGLIGVSKDIMPLAGRDRDDLSRYYIAAAAGLPWAATLGAYAADVLIDGRSEFDAILTPYRHFTYGPPLQNILGKRLTFALSHLTTLQSL